MGRGSSRGHDRAPCARRSHVGAARSPSAHTHKEAREYDHAAQALVALGVADPAQAMWLSHGAARSALRACQGAAVPTHLPMCCPLNRCHRGPRSWGCCAMADWLSPVVTAPAGGAQAAAGLERVEPMATGKMQPAGQANSVCHAMREGTHARTPTQIPHAFPPSPCAHARARQDAVPPGGAPWGAAGVAGCTPPCPLLRARPRLCSSQQGQAR